MHDFYKHLQLIYSLALFHNRYTYLVGKSCFSLQSFRVSWIGRMLTHYLVSGLEMAHVVPSGSSKAHTVLLTAADGLVASGKLQIFTPLLRIVARKPLK